MAERIELRLEMAEQIRSHEVVWDHLIGWRSRQFLRLGVTFLPRAPGPSSRAPHRDSRFETNEDGARDKNLRRIPDASFDAISPQLTIFQWR